MRSVSRAIPGFGGLYFDSAGRVTVLVQPGVSRAAVRGRIVSLLTLEKRLADARTGQGRTIRFATADFDYEQLATWRDLLSDALMSVADVVSIDLDEVRNRIAVGLASDAARRSVSQVLETLNIPAAAVIAERQEPLSLASQTLQDRFRPITAGTRVDIEGSGSCTLTLLAVRYTVGQTVMIVPGHCSRQMWSLDNGRIAQPFDGYGYFGQETFDRPGYFCGTALLNGACRYAEISTYNVQPYTGAPNEWSFTLGRIARTQGRTWGYTGVGGSTVVDSASPYFQITATTPYPYVGDFVNKVGYSTGWTYGMVYKTCVDYLASQTKKVVCNDYADLGVNHGDSGAPVFYDRPYESPPQATFVGMVWAIDPSRAGGSVFSNYNQMTQELGSLIVY